jgi:hypothetical protein
MKLDDFTRYADSMNEEEESPWSVDTVAPFLDQMTRDGFQQLEREFLGQQEAAMGLNQEIMRQKMVMAQMRQARRGILAPPPRENEDKLLSAGRLFSSGAGKLIGL